MSANPFDEVRDAVRAAKTQLDAADSIANSMAGLLVGRLRHVYTPEHLKALKKELRGFNMTTGKWDDSDE